MEFEGDQGSMANTLFPIYQRQAGLNVGSGSNGGVPFMSIPSVPLQEQHSSSYVPWSHNTHNDPYELSCPQNQVKNRKPSDVTDDGETELQGLVSNILDEASSQDSFYSDGSLSQHNNIWSPKMLRDELLHCFQSEPKTQYNSNLAPNYLSHDAFDKVQGQVANKEAEEVYQATINGFNTNQHPLFNFPNGFRDTFSAQHEPHKPPPGIPLPTNTYMMLLQQNNYDNVPVCTDRGNGEPAIPSFQDRNHVFRPQCEMNGSDLFYQDHYDQGMDKLAANEQYTSQDLNQLVNSFQSFVTGEEDGSKFSNVSMQREADLADKWRSPSPFMRAQGNHSAQMPRQMGIDFGSTPRDQNSATKKQLFKHESLQDLSSFNLQSAEYSPQAKFSVGHHNKMLLQRENASLPPNMNQFSQRQIQQGPLKFKPQMQKEKKRMAGFFGDGFNTRVHSSEILPEEKRPALAQNPFYDLPVSARPQRFARESNMLGAGRNQQVVPFIYAGNDPRRRHPSQLQAATLSSQSSLAYRGGVANMAAGNMVATNEMSGFTSGFNNMTWPGGEKVYYGMSHLTAPVQMNQGGQVIHFYFYLDECYDQWRCLEKERKRTEIVFSKTFLGKRTTTLPNSSLPKTPPNPSKVDHLIVNLMREQAQVSSLLDKMECLSGVPINANIYTALSKHHMAICATSARHRDDIATMSHNQHQRAPFPEEKVSDTMLLVVALRDLAATTRKLRTAVWCALQMTLPKPAPRSEPPVSEDKPDQTNPAPCEGYSYRI